jgi:carbon storage regulator CsrA
LLPSDPTDAVRDFNCIAFHFDISTLRIEGLKMRIFSRCENEAILIGEDITVTILEIQDNFVRLAITCPRMTPAYWEETLFLRDGNQEPRPLELSAATAE